MMGYCLSLKREQSLTRAVTYMNLENMMLSEISQIRKDKYCMILLTGGTGSCQTQKQKVEWWMPEAGGRGRGELLLNGYTGAVWEHEGDVEVEGNDVCRIT